jgi:hypothetical protein
MASATMARIFMAFITVPFQKAVVPGKKSSANTWLASMAYATILV